MSIKKVDLVDHTEHPNDDSFLYCLVCNTQYSANSGDYWNLPDNYIFKCCDHPMVLAQLETRIKVIKE